MEEQEISQGNELIAEFAKQGYWQIWKIGGYKPYWSTQYNSKEEAQSKIDNSDDEKGVKWLVGYVEPKFIAKQYHSSWDLLMPVLDKIRNSTNWANLNYSNSNLTTYKVDIGFHSGSFYCNIHKHWWENQYPEEELICRRRDMTTLIDVTWKAVVKFIEWHNSKTAVTPNEL